MRLFPSVRRFLTHTLILLVLAGLAAPAFAADKSATKPADKPADKTAEKPAQPDPSLNPVLAVIIKNGAKLYYMGSRAGLDGWLIVKDGQVQIAYAPAGNQLAMIGVLFGPSGENVTADQVQALLSSNKELTAMLTSVATGLPPGAPVNANAVAASALPPSTLEVTPANAESPGERLLKELQQKANGITVGAAGAPLLYMVVDPGCPHCKATWKVLRDMVFKNALQIRLIPIGTLDSDRERAAAVFLHTADPLNAWDKYAGGDQSQLAGAPDPALLAAVRANGALIDSWHIDTTPYLAWRGKDGKVKILRGEPDNIGTVLSDIQ
jgi:hypothetical protein